MTTRSFALGRARRRRRPRRPPWKQHALRWLLHRPDRWLRWLGGGAVHRDGQTLEPALGVVLRGLNRGFETRDLTPQAARRRFASRSVLVDDRSPLMHRIDSWSVLGTDQQPVPMRIYEPPDLPARPPAILYFHGGGWVFGDLDTHDALCRVIASQVPAKLIAVDYRRAPEHRFPAAHDDAVVAYRGVASRVGELGIDPGRLVVMGDSAGGNLAAAVALATRDDATPPAAQVLLYPVTDGRRTSASYATFAEGFGLTRDLMDWFFTQYLPSDELAVDPRISPILAADHSRLAPAIITTAGFDVLRDEGDAYARCLEAAGVDVVHQRWPHLIHGYAAMTAVEPCRRALDQTLGELAYRLRKTTPETSR